ncbi:hypothetical protein GOODEAATRI_013134 [Goodea atripinnis]|uniref:Ubiquitin-like domain-containing protein n=1 Tax=Goodea atripinnis TaxID=208336 RepID=A0ABV0MHK7_9TELE
MGNIFQCCHALLSFFKCQDAPVQGGAEQSPLLSSEESDFDSLSLPYNFNDSIINPSAGITNPVLEPGHFLFPDIILSTNPGGEVTLVEPMVCLLVSEEDEEQGLEAGQPGDKGEIRSHREGGFTLFYVFLKVLHRAFMCFQSITLPVLHSQVSGQMLVSELHQVLMDHEITCHRTCFSLQLGNTVLDSLTKLRSIQGIQDGALIRVVEGN